jgi:Holliday junction resolvase RusA-like endonuclease
MELTFGIAGLPPSYNKHFQIIYNLREVCLTPEAHAFKNRVKMSIPPCEFKSTDKFSIEIEYHSNFVCKNGSNRKIDLQNLDKLLIDALFEKIGLDDSSIWEMKAWKVQSEKDKTVVRLRTI